MSDTAPWEDYAAPAATATPAAQSNDAAPWEDYAPVATPAKPTMMGYREATPEEAKILAAHPELAPGYNGPHTNGLQLVGGLGEAGLQAGTGFLGSLGGGLTYLSTLALTRGDMDAAKAVQEATEDALTYRPRTDTGKDIVGGIGQVAQSTLGRATDYLSDKAADVGGPVAGASVKTTLKGAPYVLGLGPEMAIGRGALKFASNPATGVRAAVKGARELAPSMGDVSSDAAANAAAIEGAPKPAPDPKVDPTSIQYDRNGTAITPKIQQPAPAPSDTIGTSAATPPKFESAPPPTSGVAEPALSGPLSSVEQAQRAATLKAVGLDEARTSAVTGDKKAAATDYQVAKLDTEGGKAAAEAFEQERTALGNHTDQLVADAGGSSGLDETSLHNRGRTILQPFEDLSDHYDNRIRELYQQADAKAQGMPVDLKSTTTTLGNRPAFIGTTDGQQLLRGVNAYLRQAGIVDDAGTFGGATVQQAERIKQYLNDQWSPRTGKLIRAVKDAIDDDVTQSAGEDVYGQARALRRARANLLDDPKGVASLLESSGPKGINRAVNVERIPDTVARMPVDQFGHIVDTLRGVAPELQTQAQAAIGEIRAQFMLRLQEQAQKLKGAWNNRGVTQYLNTNSAKLAKVFSPAELERLKTLNSAGHILDVDRTYPGAAVQGHNLVMRGAIEGIKHGAGALGAHVAGPVGAMAGEVIGGKLAGALEGSASRKAWKKRVRKL